MVNNKQVTEMGCNMTKKNGTLVGLNFFWAANSNKYLHHSLDYYFRIYSIKWDHLWIYAHIAHTGQLIVLARFGLGYRELEIALMKTENWWKGVWLSLYGAASWHSWQVRQYSPIHMVTPGLVKCCLIHACVFFVPLWTPVRAECAIPKQYCV